MYRCVWTCAMDLFEQLCFKHTVRKLTAKKTSQPERGPPEGMANPTHVAISWQYIQKLCVQTKANQKQCGNTSLKQFTDILIYMRLQICHYSEALVGNMIWKHNNLDNNWETGVRMLGNTCCKRLWTVVLVKSISTWSAHVIRQTIYNHIAL